MKRRTFVLSCAASTASVAQPRGAPPNILWITCEDTGPQLGCYGDKYANTPNLDRLAARGARYRTAWSNAPVCAPARTTIISGMYPPSTGSEHMRSMVKLPEGMRMYPCYLRDAGYYTTNNSKEDYNLEHTGKVWDESSPKAHWRNRKPVQPFFAIFNNVITHESQIRKTPHTLVHDATKAPVPVYQPDVPEVRRDWAQHYDNITTMDDAHGKILKQLEEDGLAESTIVFFYGDHGAGMPRSKRSPCNSGLHVPLIVYVPDKYKHLAPQGYGAGKVIDRMVSFVDLAPTLLSLAGIKPPAHLQGRAFMGQHSAPARPYLFGFRGRMDERIDMVRSCRDERYVYVRNFMPHRIYGQYLEYMFAMPTTRVWRKMYDAGELKPPQTYFWETKPSEELYDLQADHEEVKNLAGAPEHRERLIRMRRAVHDFMLEIHDVGLLPECEMLSRSGSAAPWQTGHDKKLPLERILETAEMASSMDPKFTKTISSRLTDSDSVVRYWAALGIQMRGASAVGQAAVALRTMLKDQVPAPRIAAAEALGQFSNADDRRDALAVLVDLAAAERSGAAVAILALNAIASMGEKAKTALESIRALPLKDPASPARLQEYPRRLVDSLTSQPTER
ncbi:MAG: sulfatase-like hydrolase/transferase [Bryobacteraceae bacterium]|nr:sulfatase-like hydrolase/transferase [Bryobacteraceae bacterium]